MCGIVGYSGNFDLASLQSATEALRHRGPDDLATYQDENESVGLGHTRLAIVDLSPLGAQPMASDDGDVVVSYNGEIYNHLDLRTQLEELGHRFRGHSDTETLLHLYLEHGEAMFPMLNGIFAIAIWDKSKANLLIARDGMGVKPLYISSGRKGVAFSSEIKALLHLVPEARSLDPASLHRYLSFLWCPGEGTPLKEVRKVAPGEAISIRNGVIRQRWIWHQLPGLHSRPKPISEADAISGTAEHLRRAVHRQMMADVPVGAFLSGGLDSSAIVAFAKEKAPDIQCFSIDIRGHQEAGVIEDLPYARRVADHLGVRLDVVSVHADDMASGIEELIAQLDEPLADPAPLNVLHISRLARQHGIRVLLSGAGGDDLFTGYRRHAALTFEPLWTWLPQSLRLSLSQATASLDQRRPSFRKLAKLFEGAVASGNDRLINYFRWSNEPRLFDLYSAQFRAELGTVSAGAPMREFVAGMDEVATPLEKMLVLEQRFFLADHNLLYTDKMSMAAGVEARVPFLDNDLVAFAADLPMHYKQRGRQGKWVLKKAMEPFLPHDVIYRPKTGFGAPIRRWMRHDLRPLLAEMLSAESLQRRGIFDPKAVLDLIAENDAGTVDASYLLLSILSIEIWCRAFLDSPLDNDRLPPAGMVQNQPAA